MDANQKQRIYDDLAPLEAELNAAEPDSLRWEFWCRILETVEQLPEGEQDAWKATNIAKLRQAVKGVQARVPVQGRPNSYSGNDSSPRGKARPAS